MSSLLQARSLQELNIAAHGVGDEYACALAAALPGLPHLESIDAADNRMGDVGARALIEAARALPRLVKVRSRERCDGTERPPTGSRRNLPRCSRRARPLPRSRHALDLSRSREDAAVSPEGVGGGETTTKKERGRVRVALDLALLELPSRVRSVGGVTTKRR